MYYKGMKDLYFIGW